MTQLSKSYMDDFKNREKDAEYINDYTDLAEEILLKGDNESATRLIKKAEEVCETFDDYRDLADYLASEEEDEFNDKEWALLLFKKANKLASSFGQACLLGEALSFQLSGNADP